MVEIFSLNCSIFTFCTMQIICKLLPELGHIHNVKNAKSFLPLSVYF